MSQPYTQALHELGSWCGSDTCPRCTDEATTRRGLLVTDRGRAVLLLIKLEKTLPTLHPFAARAIMAKIEEALSTYATGEQSA
jgi:hypothetical protein